jgi:hypothetical protein
MHTAAAGALGAPDEPSLGPRRELIVLRRRAPAYGAWKMVGYKAPRKCQFSKIKNTCRECEMRFIDRLAGRQTRCILTGIDCKFVSGL